MRRLLLLALSMMFLLIACSGSDTTEILTSNSNEDPIQPNNEEKSISKNHLNYLENLFNGGVSKDGIPAIDTPQYTDIDNANTYINDDDQVFVYQTASTVYVYPQKILVWHEIVNENIDGIPLIISYCPLTGTAICYEHNKPATSFGVSGSLINSNLVMYDRASDDLWPQMLGINITERNNDIRLAPRSLHWMKWSMVKETFDHAFILTTDTGAIRDYERDPYGSYREATDNNYYINDQVYFKLMNESSLYPPKTLVVGIVDGNLSYAIKKTTFSDNNHIYFAKESLVAVKDPTTELIYVYYNTNLSVEEDYITDGSNKWYFNGYPMNSSVEPLSNPLYYEAFWFAWYAYYPETEVVSVND